MTNISPFCKKSHKTNAPKKVSKRWERLPNRPSALWLALGLLCAVGCRSHAPAPQNPAPKSDQAAPVKFVDTTQQAGIAFRQYHGGCGKRYFVEQVAAGAAVLDANGDGLLDIYFPQPKALGDCAIPETLRQRLYLNNGKGGFTLAPNAFGGSETDYGIAAAVGDYDNDGHPDLYVCCYGRNTLYRNNGDGTFSDKTLASKTGLKGFSTGGVWFDADNDGKLDLYVLRYCEWSVKTDISCPGPNGEPNVCQPTTYLASQNVLYHNNGDGTFTDITDKAGVGKERRRSLGAAAADFDGDGRLDLFVANDLGPNSLFLNRGGNQFEENGMIGGVAFGITGAPQANMGVAVGDYDEDGDLDTLVTTFQNEPKTLYRNDGRYFTDVSGETGLAGATMRYLGFGAGFFDARNMGRLDLFLANGHVSPYSRLPDGTPNALQANQLLLNNGSGRFAEALGALPADDVRVHRGACFGDFDNDGRLDILVTASDDRPTLLHNESSSGAWLQIRLINREGCATPVGAQCIATIQGKKRLRCVLGGGSYGGDSDTRLHFGLGDAKQADSLEIRWLSGKKQLLKNVPANQILTLREETKTP